MKYTKLHFYLLNWSEFCNAAKVTILSFAAKFNNLLNVFYFNSTLNADLTYFEQSYKLSPLLIIVLRPTNLIFSMQEKNKYFWATKTKGILAKYKLLKEVNALCVISLYHLF